MTLCLFERCSPCFRARMIAALKLGNRCFHERKPAMAKAKAKAKDMFS